MQHETLAMIREGGKMWGPDGKPKDTKAVMPESTYARIYQEMKAAFQRYKVETVNPQGVDAIREDKPYNEAHRGAVASLVTSMGRMAAHSGQEITYEQILNSDHEMAPGLDRITMDSAAPLVADAKGRYPMPQPGIVTQREY